MRKVKENKTGRIIKTVGAVVLLIAIMTMVSLLVARPTKNRYEGHPIGSTYSADPGGCELMYRLFNELGFNTYQHRRPLLNDKMPEDGVDIIWHNSATEPFGGDEIDWVTNWVAAGGTLVLVDNPLRQLTAGGTSGVYGLQNEDRLIDHWLRLFDISSSTRDVTPLGGSGEYDKTPYRLSVRNRTEWELGIIDEVYTYKREGITSPMGADETESLKVKLRDGFGSVVVVGKYKSGQVWFVSDPYIFSNMLLQDADNAVLAGSIAASARGGDFSSILFDEYHLGFTQSVTLADAARTPLGRGILYLCAVGVLAIAIAGARFGPVRQPKGAIGVSQRAFVSALAGLWQGANAVPAAADALWKRYGSRQGIRRKGLDRELDQMRTSRHKVDELLDISRKLDG